MVLSYENGPATMDAASTRHASTTSFGSPRSPLESRHLQHTRHCIPRLEWKRSSPSSTIAELPLLSPTASCCSHDSFAESEVTMSTAPSSPPRSPKKFEHTETQLYSIPTRRPLPGPDAGSLSSLRDVKLPPMIRRASAEGNLPGLSSILPVPRTTPTQVQGIQSRLDAFKLSPSPDPSAAGDYILSQHSNEPRTPDPITGYLNGERERRGLGLGRNAWSERKSLPQPPLLPSFVQRLPLQADHAAQQISPRRASYDTRTLQAKSADSLRQIHRGGIRKRAAGTQDYHHPRVGNKKLDKEPHNNKRYTREQMDFIRYLKIDVGSNWNEIEYQFAEYFTSEERKRQTQGVQGVYYRQNNYLPELELESNTIVYLPNGHMKHRGKKCRNQGERKLYGIINLWPEAALTYPWVKEEDRLEAAKHAPKRRQEREDARQLAVENNLWTETVPENSCACCQYAKREK